MTAPLKRKAYLIIANPTESDSDDSGSDGPPPPLPSPNTFSIIDPPAPILQPANTFQLSMTRDDLSGSSRSSTAPDTTPPPTPGQGLAPLTLSSDHSLTSKDRSYHFHQIHERDVDMHGIGRAPLHVRRTSNEPNTTSPTSVPKSYAALSPIDHIEPRIIMATADSDIWIKVDITSAHNGEAVRELIFTALQIADEDQLGFSLFQTELGESALGDALSNDHLFDMCTRSADRKGSLKFIIQHPSPQIYRPDIRALPIPPPPSTIPPLPKAPPPQLDVVLTSTFRTGTRNGTRASPQSQHDTASSTSDRRKDFAGAYDASLSDDFDSPGSNVRLKVGLLRPQRSHQQLPRPPQIIQSPKRPSVGIFREPRNNYPKGFSSVDNFNSEAMSPLRSSPEGFGNDTPDSASNHAHQLPYLPSVAPLQIDRRGSITPTPPSHGPYGASLSPPNSREGSMGTEPWRSLRPHNDRRSSAAAAERERLLEQSELRREQLEQRATQARRDRERDKERKEQTQQIRSEHTVEWQLQQQVIHQERNGGDSSTSQSPSDMLPSSGSWLGGERPEARRPGTTGTAMQQRVVYRDNNVERDRPSTAQPILGPGMSQPSPSYQTRGTPTALLPGGPARPNTGSSTGSGTPRSLQRSYRQQQVQSGGSNTVMQQLEARSQSSAERGQAVPRNWVIGYRAHDVRTAPLAPHHMPLSAGSKSMDNLRNQYFASSPTNGKTPLRLQTGITRRLPTPSSSQRVPPNNYGGPSEYGTSPTATLPYYDQPATRSGLSNSYGASAGRNTVSSSGTITPSDYIAGRSGNVPWRDDRPRSPVYNDRMSPGLKIHKHEDLREPRPPYVTPVVRSAASFGQAAQNLTSGLTPSKTSDTAPTLPSPLEDSESKSDTTLQPTDHQWISKMLDGEITELPAQSGSEESTIVPSWKPPAPQTRSPPRPMTNITPTLAHADDESEYDSDESESEAGTLWQPVKKRRSSKIPSLHPIQTGILSIPPVPPLPPPQPPHKKTTSRMALSPSSNSNRYSSFTKRDSITWAFRPPPEDMYERLEEFFPDHDLDKPVIDATPSGGSSPTQAEHPPVPAFPPASRARHKKSIRVVVSDRKSKMGSAAAQNMLRKRSTKLWGSRVEEVTPAQAKAGALSATPDSPPGPPNPKPIFKWVKGELIGKGTYGRVYLALNATTGEMIAVKQVELPRTISDQDDSRQLQVVEALKSESDTLKDLDHPNVVQYLGVEQSTDFLSIFLEYVPGGSIGGCLRKQGKFDHDVVRSFTSQMLAGLEYLHSRGILHRDLKADNILLDPSGICKISDFGISKRSDDIYDNDTALTAMQGSIFWMAPEVLHNDKRGYNAKIDIWSLGCVVLEMWAGRRPWNQEDIVAVMFKLGASREAPPVPDDVELNEVEDNFRRQCFAVNPDDRPTAAELRKHKFLELKPGWVFTGFT